MRTHDDPDVMGRLPGGGNRQKVQTDDVAHALAKPSQASVQTMLEVQRLAGNAGMNSLLQRSEEDGAQSRSPVLDVVGGGGAPLPDGVRNEMEGRLGADFSDVSVHTDSKASDSARAVQANAYTVGNDVVVRQDRWAPETDDGKKTIAHELTHVMQQRAGPVAGTSTGDGISVSDPSDKFERAAEATASSVMAQPAASTAPTASRDASAQLHADDDVQRVIAQREAAPEEEEEAQMQREAAPEEEEEAQMQREGEEEEEEAQMQRQSAAPEEEEAAKASA